MLRNPMVVRQEAIVRRKLQHVHLASLHSVATRKAIYKRGKNSLGTPVLVGSVFLAAFVLVRFLSSSSSSTSSAEKESKPRRAGFSLLSYFNSGLAIWALLRKTDQHSLASAASIEVEEKIDRVIEEAVIAATPNTQRAG